jgi:hypothetical protein
MTCIISKFNSMFARKFKISKIIQTMKLKNYIKYISLVATFALLVTGGVLAQAQVLAGNTMVTTLVDNVKTIAVPNCDYGKPNTTGTFNKNIVGYIVGSPVTYKCIDGITVEFLNVSFQTGTGINYKASTGYINSKSVKVSSIPSPNQNIASIAVTLKAVNPMIKPKCVPSTSNEAGSIASGVVGSVINANVTFICPDKSILNLIYVRYVTGTGGNRDSVEGYVMKSDVKITNFDATQKTNIMVAQPSAAADLLYKPMCKTTKGYSKNVFANVSQYSIGNVIGTAYKMKCNGVFETFYNVGFPRDLTQVEGDYYEGYINAKNVKLTPIGITKVADAVKTVTNYTKALYKSPTCTFVTGNSNDLGSELGKPRPAINGKIVGELTLTCGTVKNTFYKVIFGYSTTFEYHENVTGYIKSTDL